MKQFILWMIYKMYKKWDILIINFPFSNFEKFKLRPVLLWELLWDDILVMPITSNSNNLFWNYILKKSNINNLKVDSYLKPFNLYTVNKWIIKWKLWKIELNDLNEIKIICKKFCR